jgi:hypothetical protein
MVEQYPRSVTIAPFAWTHEKTQVEFDGETLTIKGKRLPLDQIERLARNVSRSTAQGSWNRLDCSVHLFAKGEESSVKFRGDASKEEWGPWRPMWDQLDLLVHHEIKPRILERLVTTVTAGTPVEIGSSGGKGRGRFTVSAESLQARSWLSKPIYWKSIVEMSDDGQKVVVESDGKRRKRSIALAPFEYDAWLIPLLWRYFAAN